MSDNPYKKVEHTCAPLAAESLGRAGAAPATVARRETKMSDHPTALRQLAGDLEDQSVLHTTINIMDVRQRLEPAIEEQEAELARLRSIVDRLPPPHWLDDVYWSGRGYYEVPKDVVDALRAALAATEDKEQADAD